MKILGYRRAPHELFRSGLELARPHQDQGRLPPPDDNVVLVVNSSVLRSQDQLHIHMGCLIPSVKLRLHSASTTLEMDHWTRLENFIPGADMWAYPTGRSRLSGIEPFRLAADEFDASTSERARKLTVAVTMFRGAAGDEFVILASRADVDQKWPYSLPSGLCRRPAQVATMPRV